jgi:hypothetical protein
VTKLNVRVLPCVIAFVNSVSVDRIIGFEGLGTGDKFETKDLEGRLLRCGVLVREKIRDGENAGHAQRAPQRVTSNDDDDDWD